MASLHDMPAEILISIAKYIQAAQYSITPLATTSKQCQTHIEPLNFRYLCIRGSAGASFVSRILSEGRFAALRMLKYEFDDDIIPLPNIGDSLRISEEELSGYSVAFTTAIRKVLVVLLEKSKMFENHPHPGLDLTLAAPPGPPWPWSDGNTLYLNAEQNDEEEKGVEEDEDDEVPNSLRRAWLKLPEESSLPVLPIVTSFCVESAPHSRLFDMIWPQSWTALVSSTLPSLKKVDIDAFGNERKASISRIESRMVFGYSLQSLPSTITDVSLRYLTYPPADQFFRPPNLMDPQLGYDVLSYELGILSQRLVKLVVNDATLDLVAFFNSVQSDSQWPKLENLDFPCIQIACADGTWYFNMDSRVDEYEQDPGADTLDNIRLSMGEDALPAAMDVVCNPFRLAMDKEKFRDVYVAAARAVRKMPKLRRLCIGFDVQGDIGAGPGIHGFYYYQGSKEDKENWCNEGAEVGIKVSWGVWPAVDVRECQEVFEEWREVGETKGATIELYVQQSEDEDDFKLVE